MQKLPFLDMYWKLLQFVTGPDINLRFLIVNRKQQTYDVM